MGKIRAVVIDDSAFMRKSISLMLESDPDIEVIATGKDGLDGFNKVKELRPDIVTLDVEMPVMDGLAALKKIMTECPTSVIMVSSITTEGAEATLKALEYGAVDFIPKELSFVSVNIIQIKEDLIKKVKEIVKQKSLHSRLQRIRTITSSISGNKTSPIQHKEHKESASDFVIPRIGFRAVALGISTGGPLSLQQVIPKLEKKLVPIFIVQHMPPKFTKSLAERLNGMSNFEVKEAENQEVVKKGCVYIAPGGYHMTFRHSAGSDIVIDISETPSNTLHRPSVDVMLSSVVDVYGKYALGIIMTGMGKDGFEAVKKLKAAGGYCIAQDEESCVVYGMPKAVVEGGLADMILPLEKIPETLNKLI